MYKSLPRDIIIKQANKESYNSLNGDIMLQICAGNAIKNRHLFLGDDSLLLARFITGV